MNELHLFAGAGGGILGGMLLGHRTVCAVEIEPYRRSVLLQRQRDGILPWFPIWDDVRTFDPTPWRGLVDVVAGGFPCRGFSTSGLMEGFDNEQSGLWTEMFRVARAIRPRHIFLENTPAIARLGLGRLLSDLASIRYDARWGVLGGADCGCDTDGKRFWLLATAIESGREVLHRHARINKNTRPESAASVNADSPTLVDRIRRHEARCGQPAILGEFDGLPNRVDRLEAIGDSQIPIVAATAWKLLTP